MRDRWLKPLLYTSALWALVAVIVGNTAWIKPVQPTPLAATEFDHFWVEYALWNLPFFLLIVTGLLSLRTLLHTYRHREAEGTSIEHVPLRVSDKRILWIAIATAVLTVAFLIYSWFFGLVSKQML